MSPARSLRHAMLSLALLAATGLAAAQVFSPPDPDFNGRVRATTQVVLPGSEVELAGQGFKPGQRVTLLRGETALNATPYIADTEGKFTGKLTIPANAAAAVHPVVVRASEPDAASIFDLKISKTIPLSGQTEFNVNAAKLPGGLYQVAYGAASNALFVTRATRGASEVLKLNPDTLDIIARVTPGEAPPPPPRPGQQGSQGPVLYAAYGVGVDDANATVWVTNTRQNALAVYQQSDLSLIKQFPSGSASHPRDVVVNPKLGRAYVSMIDKTIAVFDTKTLEPLPGIEISSSKWGQNFGAASLALDPATGKLYTVSLGSGEVAIIDTATNSVDKVIALKNARSAVGVAWNPDAGRILVAAQGSDNLLIVNPESGEIEHDVYVGAGALNVTYDRATRLAYVSNRGADTITVVNAEGNIVANLAGGSFPNHLTTGPNGTVYAVNKARGAEDPDGDHIRRIVHK